MITVERHATFSIFRMWEILEFIILSNTYIMKNQNRLFIKIDYDLYHKYIDNHALTTTN